MNMPQDTSTSPHDPSTSAIARLIDTTGRDGPATPRDVAGQLQSGGSSGLTWKTRARMSWPGSAGVSSSPRGAIDSVTHASQRSSFTLAAGSVQAALSTAAGTRPTAWLEANYVTVLLTGLFPLTVHATPSGAAARPPPVLRAG